MPSFRLTHVVDGPPDAVLASVADVTTGATWPPTVRGAARDESGPIGVGSRFRLSMRGFGDQMVEVVALAPPGEVVLRTESSLLTLVHAYRFEPAGGYRTMVRHEVQVSFKRLGVLAAPVLYPALRVGLRLETRRLRRYFERGVAG